MKSVRYGDFAVFNTLYSKVLSTNTEYVLDISTDKETITTLAHHFASAMIALDNFLSQLYEYRSQNVFSFKSTSNFIEVMQEWWKRRLGISTLPISSDWWSLGVEKQVLQAVEDVHVETLNGFSGFEKREYATILIRNIDFFIHDYELSDQNVFNLYIDFKFLDRGGFAPDRWGKCVAFRKTDAAAILPNALDGEILMKQFYVHETFDKAIRTMQRKHDLERDDVDTDEYTNTIAMLQDILKVCDVEFKHFNHQESFVLCDMFSNMHSESVLQFAKNTVVVVDNLHQKTEATDECKKLMSSIFHTIAFYIMHDLENSKIGFSSSPKTDFEALIDDRFMKQAYQWLSGDADLGIASLINRDDDSAACKTELEAKLKPNSEKDSSSKNSSTS